MIENIPQNERNCTILKKNSPRSFPQDHFHPNNFSPIIDSPSPPLPSPPLPSQFPPMVNDGDRGSDWVGGGGGGEVIGGKGLGEKDGGGRLYEIA